MKIHFSGIGGIGISALAQLCLAQGDDVQGSDLAKSEIWPTLEAKKIRGFLAQTADNITADIDLLVYSEAVPETNPERVRVQELNIPQESYFSYLGKKSADFFTIAVAGTHGKTSTTALLAAGMANAKFDATVVVGTTLKEFGGSNFHAGTNGHLVVEACEYRENFRFLAPDIVVLTSVDWDHVDAFPTEQSYFEAFARFVASAKLVIYHGDDANAVRVLKDYTGRKVPVVPDKPLRLSLFGQFNQQNAQLAMAVAEMLEMDRKLFARGLQKFSGAGRRQEMIGEKNGVIFYDDYAHHPQEIAALHDGLRAKFPQKKLGIIFEPHQFSRTNQFFAEFLQVVNRFDVAAFYPIYAARDTAEDKLFDLEKELSSQNLELRNIQPKMVQSHADVAKFSVDFSDGDVILFCGAGDISAFAREYLAKEEGGSKK